MTKNYFIAILCFALCSIINTCITPFGALGNKMHISKCLSMAELQWKNDNNLSTIGKKYLERSYLNEDDRKKGIVCCHEDLNLTQALQSVGAEILRYQMCGDNIYKRISFGTESTFMKYPWSVLLVYNTEQRFHCGGTIITNQYVLTAAHCVTSDYFPLIAVRLREHDLSTAIDCAEDTNGILRCVEAALDVDIEKIIVHPDYSEVSLNNDIALLRLKDFIKFERTLRPICLPEVQNEVFDREFGIITGWGATENDTLSNVLLEADVPLYGLNHCMNIYRRRKFDDTKICASGEKQINVCKGDSGGALILRLEGYASGRKFRYLQTGIISLGTRKCGEIRNFPAVFTRIAAYRDWLAQNIEL